MSITSKDNSYIAICRLACTDDDVFDNLKRKKEYTTVLEHTPAKMGESYIAQTSTQVVNDNWDKFAINDMLCNPTVLSYSKGFFSPSTLRYVKILDDLIRFDMNPDNMNVVEIGVGYGGQYTVIKSVTNPKSYTFIDLPDVLPLVNKYIGKLKLNHDIELINAYDVKKMNPFDIVISNYALSECNQQIQEMYLENVLKFAKKGYILYNQVSKIHGINSMNLDIFVSKLESYGKRVNVYPEIPQTHPKNKLIIFN